MVAPPQAILSSRSTVIPALRPKVAGKFIRIGNEKVYVKGVTYGPFQPEADGCEYHRPERVERDFALMAASGINSVRTYTVPPIWLLDIARRHGLYVMIGVPWEQHITFLDQRKTIAAIEARIRGAIQSCAGHPAVLCYGIGNEIPATIVRWYGRLPVERLLERLYLAAKSEDPEALVTYVNYPSTEYLHLPFLDLLAFNVYLETPHTLSSYLGRLQNLATDRPLLMAEVGLDSIRNGEAKQASVLDWQISTAFAEGAAGIYAFSWTDEWYRGGQEIEDWKFGVTTRERQPKPALRAISNAFRNAPLSPRADWPFVSVVICSYNGSKTIRQTLEAVTRLHYSRYEVIVINDGSRDATPQIAAEYGVKLISIPNGGLSNARNVGWRHARGVIVAYLDDDAVPDAHWLGYLVTGLLRSEFDGICGPNLSPPDDGFIAQCVDHSPGNPTHVLIDDREAEHLPGCNMAFWRKRIEALGGFDATFRIAGDDVDFCWRMQEKGWKLGFSAAAVVWHHRRGTIKTYWKQQMNYGRAEAMLERKWPAKYNSVGHLSWCGRVYAKALPGFSLFRRQRVYHGTWGTAPFQSIYDLAPNSWSSILAMPEWCLLAALFGVMSAVSVFYPPLRWSIVAFVIAALAGVVNAAMVVSGISLRTPRTSSALRFKQRVVITGLHLLQPAARMWGRLTFGLTPWRRRGRMSFVFPWKRSLAVWDEKWRGAEERLHDLENALRIMGAVVVRGGHFDRWDLEVRGGMLGDARLLMTIEEHAQGRQYVRVKLQPTASQFALIGSAFVVAIVIGLIAPFSLFGWVLLGGVAAALLARFVYEFGTVIGAVSYTFKAASCVDPTMPIPPGSDEQATLGGVGEFSADGNDARPGEEHAATSQVRTTIPSISDSGVAECPSLSRKL